MSVRTLLRRKAEPTDERSSFADLCAEAVQVARELRELEGPASYKLTPEAFVAEAVKLAHSTPERIAELRARLEADGGATWPASFGFLRRAVGFIRSPNCTRPPRTVARLAFLDPDDTASAEAGGLGAHGLAELFAVAATIAAERHPDAFGENRDWQAWESRLAELRRRRAELVAQLERAWTAEDVQFTEAPGDLASQGYVKATFAITDGQVTVGPGCGERLLGWLLARW
jgi:hypothetical protein